MIRIVKICFAAVAVIFISQLRVLGAENDSISYQKLDGEIVKAYNSVPRDNLKVYGNSITILKKANDDLTTTGKAWKLKAQKLITISCFYECTKAIDKKLYREAYIWARRGIKRGTDNGKIGNVTLKSLYDYLGFAASELEKTPVVKNTSRESILWQIDNFQYPLIDKKVEAAGNRGRLLKARLRNEAYELIEGPALDSDGKIFVKIALIDKGDFTIKEHMTRNWQSKAVAGYYKTWQNCAEEIYRQRIQQ